MKKLVSMTWEQREKYLSVLEAETIDAMDKDEYRHYLETLLLSNDLVIRCAACCRCYEPRHTNDELRDHCDTCAKRIFKEAQDVADTDMALANEDRCGMLSGEYQYHVGKTK